VIEVVVERGGGSRRNHHDHDGGQASSSWLTIGMMLKTRFILLEPDCL
jgi:hypothetical protein